MWTEPRTVLFRIVALDESDLIGGLVREIVPLVAGAVADGESTCNMRIHVSENLALCAATRTSDTVWVDEPHGDKIVLRVEGTPVSNSKRLVRNRVADGAPHVDDANTSLEEAFSVSTEMVVYAGHRGLERLVNVDAFLWVTTSEHLPLD